MQNPKHYRAIVDCECGNSFTVELDASNREHPPVCPHCGKMMDDFCWKQLAEALACLSDYNQETVKAKLGTNAPAMIVRSIVTLL